MTHPRGEVAFEAGGRVWRLKFGVNAVATLEEETGQPFNEVFAALDTDRPRLGLFRTIVRIGLAQHHPKIIAAEAGDLIDEVGLQRMATLLGEAVKAAFPDAVKGDGPGEAAAGT